MDGFFRARTSGYDRSAGTPQQVAEETRKMVAAVSDKRRIVWSCGGGMPPDVSTENIHAFLDAIKTSFV